MTDNTGLPSEDNYEKKLLDLYASFEALLKARFLGYTARTSDAHMSLAWGAQGRLLLNQSTPRRCDFFANVDHATRVLGTALFADLVELLREEENKNTAEVAATKRAITTAEAIVADLQKDIQCKHCGFPLRSLECVKRHP